MTPRTRGLLLIASSSLCFGAMSVLVKLATSGNPSAIPDSLSSLTSAPSSAAEAVFARSLLGWLGLSAVARVLRAPGTRERPGLLMLRGVLGGLAILCLFFAIEHTQMSKAVLLTYAYPLFAALFARLFFGEQLNAGMLVLMGVALAGVTLVLRPVPGAGFNAGDAAALLASVFSGSAIATLRRLRKDEATLTVVIHFTFWCTAISLPALAFSGPRLPDASHAGLLAGIAIVSAAGQLLLTHGYKHCATTEGSTLSLLNVVVAVALGVAFLHETLSWTTWAGGALTLGACLGMLRVQGRGPSMLPRSASGA